MRKCLRKRLRASWQSRRVNEWYRRMRRDQLGCEMRVKLGESWNVWRDYQTGPWRSDLHKVCSLVKTFTRKANIWNSSNIRRTRSKLLALRRPSFRNILTFLRKQFVTLWSQTRLEREATYTSEGRSQTLTKSISFMQRTTPCKMLSIIWNLAASSSQTSRHPALNQSRLSKMLATSRTRCTRQKLTRQC